MLCAEENPAHCHRRLLVARVLFEEGARVLHIRGDGRLQPEIGFVRLDIAVRGASALEIYSIGFTKTTAESFFGRLKLSGVRRLLDVRRNTSSQLAGFAKDRDLPYFLRELVGAEYAHEPLLTPTDEILEAYKRKGAMPWAEYEERFIALLRERQVERRLDPESVPDTNRAALLGGDARALPPPPGARVPDPTLGGAADRPSVAAGPR